MYIHRLTLWTALLVAAQLLFGCSGSDSPGGLKSEAGFIEVEPVSFSLQQSGRETYHATSSVARVIYSFHPAEQTPKEKPIFVFLNGGPGCATTTNLFSMNTAPFTLDRERTNGKPYAANTSSWTRIGNLLYLDAPNTGFSYNIVEGASQESNRTPEFDAKNFNPFIDSANVIRVLLRFLDAHPSLRANQVILVGESYSGTRVSTMLNLLLFYSRYGSGEKIYKDEALAAEIGRHLSKVFSLKDTTGPFPAETIARQFGRQILIQPELSGPYQSEIAGKMFEQPGSIIDQIAKTTGKAYTRCADSYCDPETNAFKFVEKMAGRDRYIYTKPNTWSDELEAFAMKGLLDVDSLSVVFGTDVRTISLLRPAARVNAYRYGRSRELLEPGADTPERYRIMAELEADSRARIAAALGTGVSGSLEDVFGILPVYDDYLSGTNFGVYLAFMINNAILKGYAISPDTSPRYGEMFLENLLHVKTFITDAAWDLVIYSPALPEALKGYADIAESVVAKRGSDTTEGSITVSYKKGSLPGLDTPTSRTIHWPYYEKSGHSVSSTQPEKLLSDVISWLK
jgi:hypothetical protein